MRLQSKRIAVATLFGATIFLTKTILPSPIDKMFIIIHALLLALGALILRRLGATFIGLVSGSLTALWRASFAPFSFAFAVLYGLLVDCFFFIFKVDTSDKKVRTGRMIAAMAVATGLVGLLSFYTTALLFELLPRNPVLEGIILVTGTVSGAIAGYAAAFIWNRHLKNLKH